MAEGVVDGLEGVQVHNHEGVGTGALRQVGLHTGLEGGAVEQPGEGVPGRLLYELLLVALVGVDVGDDAHHLDGDLGSVGLGCGPDAPPQVVVQLAA